MGKAVLSTSVGCDGLGAVAGREIEIADAPESFADRVVALLADPERRRRLGNAGRARAMAEFAWPRVAERLLELYDELAATDGLMQPPQPAAASGRGGG
jgi:glycosyltransferase involved in cell wall biosynthesis